MNIDYTNTSYSPDYRSFKKEEKNSYLDSALSERSSLDKLIKRSNHFNYSIREIRSCIDKVHKRNLQLLSGALNAQLLKNSSFCTKIQILNLHRKRKENIVDHVNLLTKQ
jgi:hypothetical protein